MLIVLTSLQKKEEYTDNEEPQKYTEIKGGGVIMIGPIPIIFGSDYKYAVFAVILAITLMVLIIKYL